MKTIYITARLLICCSKNGRTRKGNKRKWRPEAPTKIRLPSLAGFPAFRAAACLLRTRLFAAVAIIAAYIAAIVVIIVLVVILIMTLVIVILIIAGLPSIFSFVLVLLDGKFPRPAASIFPLEFKAERDIKGKESLDFGDDFII